MKAIASLMVLTGLVTAGIARAEDATTPLQIKLPAPAFIGTPSDLPSNPNIEKPTGKPRPPMMVPAGVTLLSAGKPVTSSVATTPASELLKLTDGDKEARESSVVLLKKGVQWVQIDLGASDTIYAVCLWHNHDAFKVYHGVVVEISDDAEFKSGVTVVFNNDFQNLDSLGAGKDREYFETNEGKLIDAKGTKGRYVRVYSDGSTESKLNEFSEVEVYGKA